MSYTRGAAQWSGTQDGYYDGDAYHMYLPMPSHAPAGHTTHPPRGQLHSSRRGQDPVASAAVLDESAADVTVDMSLFSDIQRTAELVREFKRLKTQGGTCEERRSLQRRVKALRAAYEAHYQSTSPPLSQPQTQMQTVTTPSSTPPPPPPPPAQPSYQLLDQRPLSDAHVVPRTVPAGQRLSTRHADPNAPDPRAAPAMKITRRTPPSSPPPRPAAKPAGAGTKLDEDAFEDALVREEQDRVYRSMCFAIVLAESHVRHELLHRWERRWLKLKAACAEERVWLALAPTRSPPLMTPAPPPDANTTRAREMVVRSPDVPAAEPRPRPNDAQVVQEAAPPALQPQREGPMPTALIDEEEHTARAELDASEARSRQGLADTAQQLTLLRSEAAARAALTDTEDDARTSLNGAATAAEAAVQSHLAEVAARDATHRAQREQLEGDETMARDAVVTEEAARRQIHVAALSATRTHEAERTSHQLTEATERQALAQHEENARASLKALHDEARAAARVREQRRLAEDAAARKAQKEREEAEARAKERAAAAERAKEERARDDIARSAHKKAVSTALEAVASAAVCEALQTAARSQYDAEQAAAQREEEQKRQEAQRQQEEAEAIAKRAREEAAQQEAAAVERGERDEAARSALAEDERDNRRTLESDADDTTRCLVEDARRTLGRQRVLDDEHRARGVLTEAATKDWDTLVAQSEEDRVRVDTAVRAREASAAADALERQRRAQEAAAARAAEIASSTATRTALFALCDEIVGDTVRAAAIDYLDNLEREREAQEAAEQQAEALRRAHDAAMKALQEALQTCVGDEQEGRHVIEEAAKQAHAALATEAASSAAAAAAVAAAAERAKQEADRKAEEDAEAEASHQRHHQQAADAAAEEAVAMEKREVSADLGEVATTWILRWIREVLPVHAQTSLDESPAEEATAKPEPADVSAEEGRIDPVPLDASLAALSSAHTHSDYEDDELNDDASHGKEKSEGDDATTRTPDRETTAATPAPQEHADAAAGTPSPLNRLFPLTLIDSCHALLDQLVSEAALNALTVRTPTATTAPAESATMTSSPLSGASAEETVLAQDGVNDASPLAAPRATADDGEHGSADDDEKEKTAVSSDQSGSDDDDDEDVMSSERSFETMSPKAAGATIHKSLSAAPHVSPPGSTVEASVTDAAVAAGHTSPSPASESSESVFEFPILEKDVAPTAAPDRPGCSGRGTIPLVSPRQDSAERNDADDDTATADAHLPTQRAFHSLDPAMMSITAEALVQRFIADAARIHHERVADPSVPICASPRRGGALRGTGGADLHLLDSDVAQAVAMFVVHDAGATLTSALNLSPLSSSTSSPPLCDAKESGIARRQPRHVHTLTQEDLTEPLLEGMVKAALVRTAPASLPGSPMGPNGDGIVSATASDPALVTATRLPDEWHAALRGLAERLAADAFQYIAQRYLRATEAAGLRGDDVYQPDALEQLVHKSVNLADMFNHHISPHDCRYLALYYLECVRRGVDVVDPVVAHSQRVLRENLFLRPTEGCVRGAPTTGAATTLTQRKTLSLSTPATAVARTTVVPTMDVRRAGLTQMVLEHALENVMQDVLLDTAAWLTSVL